MTALLIAGRPGRCYILLSGSSFTDISIPSSLPRASSTVLRLSEAIFLRSVSIAFSLLNLLLFFGGSLFRRIKNLRRQKEYRDSFTNRSDYWDNDPWRR